MATRLHILPAMEGDAFILTVEENGNKFTMVIDGGPLEAYKEISDELNKLEHINLLVVTHFDADHSEGIIEWLKEDPSRLQIIDKMWINCADDIPVDMGTEVSAYGNHHSFKEFMENITITNPDWNVVWKDEIIAGKTLTSETPYVKIQVIAPSENARDIYKEEYKKLYPAVSAKGVAKQMEKSLKDLADEEIDPAYQKVNNSSIAMIIQTRDKSYLMTGDSMATDMYNFLTEHLQYSKDNPLHVDVMKMPHHGSRYNINNDLLDVIDCNKYLITTDGGSGNANHPDRQTIAKILKRDGRPDKHIEIHLNYSRNGDMKAHGSNFLTDEEINDDSNNFELKENTEWL